MNYLVIVSLFLLSFSLTYLIKNYAVRKSLVVKANERSSHTIPTPQGGGIAIAITWFIGLGYLYFTDGIDLRLFYALLAGIIISFVSFLDDIYELSPKIRLIIQIFVATLGLYFLGGLYTLHFGSLSSSNQILTNLFAFLLIIWFVNLYNFLDGINGYAGSEAVFLSIAGYLLFGGKYFLILAVAALGFLYWNFGNRAKIFMGDVGSTLLGYNVAIFTIYYANQEPNNLWTWIVLFGVFWFDATMTLIKRKLNGEKLLQAHKKHAYQLLTQTTWSHKKVVLGSIIINNILFCLVYFLDNKFLALGICILFLAIVMFFIERKTDFR